MQLPETEVGYWIGGIRAGIGWCPQGYTLTIFALVGFSVSVKFRLIGLDNQAKDNTFVDLETEKSLY
jgi:hypothetical protein